MTVPSNLSGFLLTTALSTIEGLVFAILCGAVGGIAIGTTMGMAFCLALGIASGMKDGLALKSVFQNTKSIVSNNSLGVISESQWVLPLALRVALYLLSRHL